MRHIFNTLTAVCLCGLCAVSCIYPFEAKVSDADSRIVIDGDILIGSETTVSLGYMWSLSAFDEEMVWNTPLGNVWVEDDRGDVYENETKVPSEGASSFTIDTRLAPTDRQYRLHFKDYGTDREYVSSWTSVNPAPVIDGIGYELDDDNVNMTLSAHSDDGGQYFRWTYDELWKYHAEYAPDYEFDTKEQVEVLRDQPDESLYYCWGSNSSKEVDLCATADLSANRLKDHKFLAIDRSNQRMMIRYRINVSLRCISADAYRYLYNLKITSNYTGSLFSPNPSDVVGNITCLDDPDENVIGYIDVCRTVSKMFYIDQRTAMCYKAPASTGYLFIPPADEDGVVDLMSFWRSGYVPIMYGLDTATGESGVLWDYKRCIDCRTSGGTLTMPEDWEE